MAIAAINDKARPTTRTFFKWFCSISDNRTQIIAQFFGAQSNRQGERSGQCRKASVAQVVVLSVWHVVQGFGILYLSVIAGVIKAKVCARTFTSAIVVSIFGM